MSRPPTRTRPPVPAVVWHELECGSYRADLELWLRLAAAAATDRGARAPVLDIGAGTGRVTLELARAGHPVTALDIDPVLLEELSVRAGGLPVTPVLADARTFALEHEDHELGLVPMQTLQLLRGEQERRGLYEHARAHLRAGALLAMAIVTDVDTFDSRHGGLGPVPDQERIAGDLYLSRAVLVEIGQRFIRIERERMIDPGPGSETPALGPELDVIELERLTEEQLHDEARAAGLEPRPGVSIPETYEHTGSLVVVLSV